MSTADVDMQPGSSDRENVEYLAEFLDQYYAEEIAKIATGKKGSKTLHVEMRDLQMFLDTDAYQKVCDDVLKYAHQLEKATEYCDSTRDAIGGLNVSLVDSAGADIPHKNVSKIDSSDATDYIAVTGQLSAVTKVRSFPRKALFECSGCGQEVEKIQNTKEFEEPGNTCRCEKAPNWKLDYDRCEWQDHRKLKVQEPPEQSADGGTQYVAVHVFGQNVKDQYGNPLPQKTGDDVTLYGSVKLKQQDGRHSADFLFEHYLRGEAIQFKDTGADAVDVDEHRERVKELAQREDVYDYFAENIAPQIHPTEQMKFAMDVCAAYLFAAPRIDNEGGSMYRGDIHAALIGDPGMAKSVLLNGVSDFSPDCEHRSATGLSSDVGLVAAAVEDDFDGGGWTLKPGILVRSGYHAVIDEIDKGPDKLEKINDALEGRQIASIDKAGMKADLKTRTGMLCSGNPEGSRFTQEEPLPNQVDIDESLLTRFDCIVLLIDNPDEEQDRKIANHITDSYMEGIEVMKDNNDTPDTSQRDFSKDVAQAWVELGRGIVPSMTEEAKEKLQEFYVDVRGENDSEDTISATARQLEAGLRLSMAYARMRLSETVDECDVNKAIHVSKSQIGQTFDGETGQFNIDKLTVETVDHSSDTQDARIASIKDALEEHEAKTPAEVADVIAGVDEQTAEDELEKLARKGEVLRPQTGCYRLT